MLARLRALGSTCASLFFRKLGQYCDSSDVAGGDDGKLSYADAMELRASGVLVFDEEIAKDYKCADIHLRTC